MKILKRVTNRKYLKLNDKRFIIKKQISIFKIDSFGGGFL